jgi:hypothetical protein
MLKICHVLIVLGMLFCSSAFADAQVSVGIRLPNVSIGINVPVYPELVVMPGYPVYYAPGLAANYFFYDGMYWVYEDDNWYSAYWYDGPWWLEEPEFVPLFILRIPVRYYRLPPLYFRGWHPDAPPRWGDHWGRDWEQHRSGWDNWNRHAVPAPAPLPVYQRQYSGDLYPLQVEHQHELQNRNYRYQPRDPVVRQHYQEQVKQRTPVQQGNPSQNNQRVPEQRGSRQEDMQRAMPHPQVAPGAKRPASPQREGEDLQRSIPTSPQQRHPEAQDYRQPIQPELDQRRKQMPGSQGREEGQPGKDFTRGPRRKQGQDQEQERGRDRNE